MRKSNKKIVALVVSIALLLCIGVGSILAYLTDETDPVVNTFTSSNVSTLIEETFTNGVKSNVTVKNTGDTDANIRAAVVVTWQDAEGNVYGKEPVAGTDYTITFNTSEQTDPAGKWELKSDGFYYWSNPVAAQASTGVLIATCTTTATPPEGYTLCVEIIASGIQSVGIPEGSHPWGI